MATIEKSTAKRGVGRPAFVADEMLGQVKAAPVGEWVEIGEFEPVTAASRASLLRTLQGNIEVKVTVTARRVRGKASRPTRKQRKLTAAS